MTPEQAEQIIGPYTNGDDHSIDYAGFNSFWNLEPPLPRAAPTPEPTAAIAAAAPIEVPSDDIVSNNASITEVPPDTPTSEAHPSMVEEPASPPSTPPMASQASATTHEHLSNGGAAPSDQGSLSVETASTSAVNPPDNAKEQGNDDEEDAPKLPQHVKNVLSRKKDQFKNALLSFDRRNSGKLAAYDFASAVDRIGFSFSESHLSEVVRVYGDPVVYGPFLDWLFGGDASAPTTPVASPVKPAANSAAPPTPSSVRSSGSHASGGLTRASSSRRNLFSPKSDENADPSAEANMATLAAQKPALKNTYQIFHSGAAFTITYEEFAEGLSRAGVNVTPEQVAWMCSTIDERLTGTITSNDYNLFLKSLDEIKPVHKATSLAAKVCAKLVERSAHLHETFKWIDASRSGRPVAADFASALSRLGLQTRESDIQEMFMAFVSDGKDGVPYASFVAFCESGGVPNDEPQGVALSSSTSNGISV